MYKCQLSADVYISSRATNPTTDDSFKSQVSAQSVVYLPESGQVARLLSTSQVPKSVIPKGEAFILSVIVVTGRVCIVRIC